MRLFVGLALDEHATAALARLCAPLHCKDDGLRWAEEASWHLTLVFLGSVRAEMLGRIAEELTEIRSGTVPLRLGGTGVFARTGIFFAAVEPDEALLRLQGRVTAAMERCGFEPEERAYRPHITLARRRGREGAVRLRALAARAGRVDAAWEANELLLYESHPEPGRSVYIVRESFPLG